MSEPVPSQILNEMENYYRARANEYDEWFYHLVLPQALRHLGLISRFERQKPIFYMAMAHLRKR